MPFKNPVDSLVLPEGAGPGQARIVIGSELPPPLDTYEVDFNGELQKYRSAIIFYSATASNDDYVYIAHVPFLTNHQVHIGAVKDGAVIENAANNPTVWVWAFTGGGFFYGETQAELSVTQAFNIDGFVQGRGWRDRVDSAAASAAVGAEAIVLSSNNITFKDGRCYSVEFAGNCTTAVANNFLLSRIRVTNLAGTIKIFHEQKLPDVGPQFYQYCKGYIKRATGAGDTTVQIVLTSQGSAGNIQWTGAAADVRYFEVRDVGQESDYPNAVTI